MVKLPIKLKTSDGTIFDSETATECHERGVAAIEAFKQAEAQLWIAIAAKHYTTADGQPFTLETAKWIVIEPCYEPPYKLGVDLTRYRSRTEFYFQERHGFPELHVAWMIGDKRHQSSVSEFFVSEEAARQRTLELRRKHLGWWTEDLEKETAKFP